MSRTITTRQAEILDFINGYIDEHGYSPSQGDITRAFEFKSPKATTDHLIAMRDKGLITYEEGKRRTLRPV